MDPILEAVEKVRNGNTQTKNQAFNTLAEVYKFELDRALNSISRYVKPEDINDARKFVFASFNEILTAKNLQYKTVSRFESYIRFLLPRRVNKFRVRKALGYDCQIKRLTIIESNLQRAIHNFHEQEHYEPDFENELDVIKLADILNKPVRIAKKWIQEFRLTKTKSLYEKISQDSDDEFIDSLQSNSPRPDEVFYRKTRIKAVREELKKLSTAQATVFDLYYHFNDPDARNLTRSQVAKKANLSFRTTKYLLDAAKEKISKSPKLKNLMSEEIEIG